MVSVANEDARRSMEAAATFFRLLGAGITQQNDISITALVEHPDGFRTLVRVEVRPMPENGAVEILRCSGDKMLFKIIYEMLAAFDMGRGVPPAAFWDGQMQPRPVKLQCSPPPLQPPYFRLEGGGLKRKLDESLRAFDC
jgi:hypothetical protein